MGKSIGDTTEEHLGWRVHAEHKRHPAIAVVDSDLTLEAAGRTLLRAKEHGHFPFVTVAEETDPMVAALAEELGAGVLELDARGELRPEDSVEQVARVMGFPGVLYHSPDDGQIDYGRCDAIADATDGFGAAAPALDESRADALANAGSAGVGAVAAIPAYNEESTIADVVSAASEHVDEVIVVDDGSDDETVAVAEDAGATVVEHERNRGYGASLKTAFVEADYRGADRLVTLDGDGQHDSDDIPKLLEAQRETDANVVIGSRFHSEEIYVPKYRRLGLWVVNVLTNLSLLGTRSWVSDTQSGFRAFDSQAIETLAEDDTLGDGMSASTDILYHARAEGYDIEEVGTTIRYDGEDTSTQNPLTHGLSLVKNILKTVEREHPLLLLGIPGIVAVLFGLGFGYWTGQNYFQTGTFPVGLALVAIFSTFLGSLLSVAGVVLHSVHVHVETIANRTTK